MCVCMFADVIKTSSNAAVSVTSATGQLQTSGWLWTNDQLVDSQNACGKKCFGPHMFSAATLFWGQKEWLKKHG